MHTTEFAPSTGHESDYRAVGSNGLYLLPRPTAQPTLAQRIARLEADAATREVGSYAHTFYKGHAARLRAMLPTSAPVLDEAPPEPETPEREPGAEELAHLGFAGVPSEDAEDGVRGYEDDDGRVYGSTAEEEFQRD